MTQAVSATVLLVLVCALPASAAHADEFRLRDGEVLFGTVTAESDSALTVQTQAGARRLAREDVAGVVHGLAPALEIAEREAALFPEAVEARLELARFAWSRRQDAAAKRLARDVLAIDADEPTARRLLGHVRMPDGWREGWPAPWPPRGSVGPRWGASRRRALGRGASRTEPAVRLALDWLASHQDESGALDADAFPRHCPEEDRCTGSGGGHHGERVPCAFDGVTTSLAVLAWSAGGSTPVSGPHADNLRRGLDVCVSIVRRPLGHFDAIWNHAYATRAVADVAAVTRDPRLLDVLADATLHLERRQLADGGWSYVYGVGDVPTTAAVLLTLGLAAQAGACVDPTRIERALSFLEARVDPQSGRSEYHDGAERKGYTPTRANAAAALAARAALVRPGSARVGAEQWSAIASPKPRWKLEIKEVKTRDGRTVEAQVGSLYPYLWSHATFALERRGGPRWTSWAGALRKALLAGQVREGHATGSWDPLGPYSLSGGRIYVTALAALMLQAPCRFP